METGGALNDGQKKAAETLEGAVLILAGAGAGKTRTIVSRMANLIKQGVAPGSILAITFTNKAAAEMRERVAKVLEGMDEINLPISSGERPFVSTFHALGVHILRENSKVLDLPRHFTIYDRTDSKGAVREALKEAGLDPKEFDPGHLLGVISREKSNAVSLDEFRIREGGEYFGTTVAKVWERYEKILKRDKALDFDDLLIEANRLLEDGKILSHYRNIWQYVHVDEYQDTNHIQYLISKKLAGLNGNICVVGDVDQNIYSWRGARLRNILDFEKDYPEAKVIILEENYRSTKNIIAVSNLIIGKNKYRKKKTLFTKNKSGEAISIFEASDEGGEAAFVAHKVKELISSGTSPSEIAVLYRANFQSRILEEVFISENISYQLVGTRFFERKEVKDVLSFLKAALNPESLADIKRIINIPPRGIGKVSFLKIASGKVDSLPPKTKEKYSDFLRILAEIKKKMGQVKVSETVRFAIKISGIYASLKNGSDEELERFENIMELVSLSTKYDRQEPLVGIENLLTDAALESDQDELQNKKEGVKLMTVHSAKGLEFDCVFVVGLEENLFPHHRAKEGALLPEESEEERRLFYVALTRARKKIFLSFANTRAIFGAREVNLPSEFLIDIPENFLQKEDGFYEYRGKPIREIQF
jgi:DNA helicase-2/ATP-dependent DNA helicase PcrA